MSQSDAATIGPYRCHRSNVVVRTYADELSEGVRIHMSSNDNASAATWPPFLANRGAAWPAISTAAAAISGLIGTRTSGGAALAWAIALVVFSLLSAVITAARGQRAERDLTAAVADRIDAETKILTMVDSVISPLLQQAVLLAEESDTGARSERASALRQAVVTAITYVIGPTNVRASLFTLKRDATTDAPHHLECDTHFYGRGDRSRRKFGLDAEAMRLALSGEYSFVEDSGDYSANYQTYIAHGIVAGDRSYGLLTLDAKSVGDINGSDVALVRALAAVLALSYSVT